MIFVVELPIGDFLLLNRVFKYREIMKKIIRYSRRQVSCVHKSLICLISFITNDLEVVLSILDIKRMCLRHTCTKSRTCEKCN